MRAYVLVNDTPNLPYRSTTMDLGGMMNELSKEQKKLVKLLKQIKNDYDFVFSNLCIVEHPDDTRCLIDFIEHDEDVNPNTVGSYSVYLFNERYHPERNLPDGVPNRGVQGKDFW